MRIGRLDHGKARAFQQRLRMRLDLLAMLQRAGGVVGDLQRFGPARRQALLAWGGSDATEAAVAAALATQARKQTEQSVPNRMTEPS